MSALTSTPHHAPVVGETIELARYAISTGERVLYGQRIDGNARVIDRPATGRGRAFLVEPHVEQDGNAAPQALITDYLTQAIQHDQVPMLITPLEPLPER